MTSKQLKRGRFGPTLTPTIPLSLPQPSSSSYSLGLYNYHNQDIMVLPKNLHIRGRQSRRVQNDMDPAMRPTRPGIFDNLRADLHAAAQEFVGTICFLLLAFGGIQAVSEEGKSGNPSNIDKVMYISLSMGFSLLVSAWLFFRVTGGLFNPNVSLALLLTGIIGPVRFVLYCIAQLIGGIAAAGLVLALTPGSLQSK